MSPCVRIAPASPENAPGCFLRRMLSPNFALYPLDFNLTQSSLAVLDSLPPRPLKTRRDHHPTSSLSASSITELAYPAVCLRMSSRRCLRSKLRTAVIGREQTTPGDEVEGEGEVKGGRRKTGRVFMSVLCRTCGKVEIEAVIGLQIPGRAKRSPGPRTPGPVPTYGALIMSL